MAQTTTADWPTYKGIGGEFPMPSQTCQHCGAEYPAFDSREAGCGQCERGGYLLRSSAAVINKLQAEGMFDEEEDDDDLLEGM